MIITPSKPHLAILLTIIPIIISHGQPNTFQLEAQRISLPISRRLCLVKYTILSSFDSVTCNQHIVHVTSFIRSHPSFYCSTSILTRTSISHVQRFISPIKVRSRTRKSSYTNPSSNMRIFVNASMLLLLDDETPKETKESCFK